MQFTAPEFFFYFLPAFLILFRLFTPGNRLTFYAKIAIILGTAVFYGYGNSGYLIPFAFATSMDLMWSILLNVSEKSWVRRLWVTASVLQNLSIFFIFKYLNWIASVFPHLHWLQVWQHIFADKSGTIALPPGVSFYLFESLSFVIDCYRRKVQTPKNPLDFLTFISMFPRFIAGPIVRYSDLQSSINEYKGRRYADGLFVFAVGFITKILLADSLAKFVNPLFGHDLSFFSCWLVAIGYTFQLYLDFSAYSLMAIGLGVCLGFPFHDNFREPYLSSSIAEFWRRWHVSLSTWLRDYLYISLGGNRRGKVRTYINLMITMTLGGLWHGANITFIIWGFYHGLLLILERAKIYRSSRFLTFFLVIVGWVFFRADSLKQAGKILGGMIGLTGFSPAESWDLVRFNPIFAILGVIGIVYAMWAEPQIRRLRADSPWYELRFQRVHPLTALSVFCVFGVAIIFALSSVSIPFLYFQF